MTRRAGAKDQAHPERLGEEEGTQQGRTLRAWHCQGQGSPQEEDRGAAAVTELSAPASASAILGTGSQVAV